MEALRALSNDSFSYSWRINIKPTSFDALDDALSLSFDALDGDPFIEIDPRLASLRWATVDAAHDFDFGQLPSGAHSPNLAHADQIFSDGLILPLHLATPPRLHQSAPVPEPPRSSSSSSSTGSALSRSLSLDSSTLLLSLSNRFRSPQGRTLPLGYPAARRSKPTILRGCGRASKRVLQKYLCFLIPLYRKVKGLKLMRRPAGGSSVIVPSAPRSCAASWEGSPRMGDATRCRFASRAAPRDASVERSIHDAVLHCKKSIGDCRTASFGPRDEQLTASTTVTV